MGRYKYKGFDKTEDTVPHVLHCCSVYALICVCVQWPHH